MIESALRGWERGNGHGGRNLTRHSTGARVSGSLIVELALSALSTRPVNSALDASSL